MLEDANQRFRKLYNTLSKDNLEILSDLYDADVVFIDPIHRVDGLGELTEYCRNLYANLTTIQFDYQEVSYGPGLFHQDWIMTFCHPKMKQGQAIHVDGSSRCRVNEHGLITEHQDCYDVGQMIYQNIPLIGSCIQIINRRLTR